MTMIKLGFAASLVVMGAKGLKVGVIADPHYNPYFNPLASVDDNCTGPISNQITKYAPVGQYGCDIGPDAFDLML